MPEALLNIRDIFAPRHPKIYNFNLAKPRQEYIGRFEISVYDAMLVYMTQSKQDLLQNTLQMLLIIGYLGASDAGNLMFCKLKNKILYEFIGFPRLDRLIANFNQFDYIFVPR